MDCFYLGLYKSTLVGYLYPLLVKLVLIYNLILTTLNTIISSMFLIFSIKFIGYAIINMAVKFILLIALLIFVRGGIPRYRYDFLTKVGWVKFLSLILMIFLSSLLLIFLF